MNKLQVLEKYNPQWKLLFKEERDRIKELFESLNLRIEHIGSTAVEGMEARPIVDIMVGTENKRDIPLISKNLQLLDYTEMPSPQEVSGRYFFFKEDEEGGARNFTILLTAVNNSLWRKKLRKRQILKESPEEREAFIRLKREALESGSPENERYLKIKEGYFSEK